jgi:fumarate reductase subunit C
MTRKPYRPAQPRNWWRRNPAHTRYMLREATALPLLLYCLLLLTGLYQLTRGETAFAGWLAALRSPPLLALQLLALAAALYHAWTWIELVPKILVLDRGPLRLSATAVKRLHQGAALLCSLGLLGLLAAGLPGTPGGAP